MYGYSGGLTFSMGSGEPDFRAYASNVKVLSSNEVVYPAAAVCIVHNLKWNTQRFFLGHTSAVTCIAVHPSGSIVASGQLGNRPPVCIWDARPSAGATVSGLSSPSAAPTTSGGAVPKHLANLMHHTDGISCCAFSPDGALLITVGGDVKHTVCALAAPVVY